VAQALAIALNALSLAIISRRLGAPDLGAYTLERRAMALLQPLAVLGLTVATPRFIAMRYGEDDPRHAEVAVAGVTLVALLAAVAGAVLLAFPAPVAALAFGDENEVGLARCLAGFVMATALFSAVYAVLRGYLEVGPANALEIVVVGVLPVTVAAFAPRDVESLMWYLNGGIAAAALVGGVFALRDRARHVARAVRRNAGAMLRYGLARTPGDLAVVALFSVTPLVVVHYAGTTEAGYTSIVLSSLNLVSVAAVPIGVLLLPRVALDRARLAAVPTRRYELLAAATVHVSLALAALLVLASPLLMAAWLPDVPDGAVLAQQVAALGVPAYVFHLVFRSYLDAVHTLPYSSAGTVAGLAVMIATLPLTLAVIEPAMLGAATSIALGLACTGAVTWHYVRQTMRNLGAARPSGALVVWFAGTTAFGVAFADDLVSAALATIVGGALYVALLLVQRPAWWTTLLEQAPSLVRTGGTR
jgi:O-antigen/teichoic acid export membrane protein